MKSNKEMATKLRWILESKRFSDFYNEGGPLDKAITGEYRIHSEEQRENEEKVKDYIDSIIEEILS